MAEPVSAFPSPTPPTTPAKGQTVPWPEPAEPPRGFAENAGSNTETAVRGFGGRLGAGAQDYYGRIERALSAVLEGSRRRFQRMAHERPVQIVTGVAIASLLAGAAVRIWRSHHD